MSDSDMTKLVLEGLLQRIPQILVALLGVILALCAWRKAPQPAALLLAGSVVALLISIAWPFAVRFGAMRVDSGAWEGADYSRFLSTYSFISGILDAASAALLVIAAVGWRSSAPPAPWSAPTTKSPTDYGHFDRPVPPLSKGFFLGSLIASAVSTWILVGAGIAVMASGSDRDLALGGGLLVATCLPMIYGIVVGAMLVHRMWSALPRDAARTTPGKAVGLLFVPFFNFYWAFQAYWGWTVDFNRFAASRGIPAPRAPEGVAIAFVILSILAVIPYVGIVIALVNLVLLVFLVNRIADGVGAISHASGWPAKQ